MIIPATPAPAMSSIVSIGAGVVGLEVGEVSDEVVVGVDVVSSMISIVSLATMLSNRAWPQRQYRTNLSE